MSDVIKAPAELVSRRIADGWVDSVRTYPGYYDGNQITLDGPPEQAMLPALIARYRTLFAWRRTTYPGSISWCVPLGTTVETVPPGTSIEMSTALLAPVSPPECDTTKDVRLRTFADVVDWQRLIAAEEAESPQFGAFPRWRARTYERLTRSGGGQWYALENMAGEMLATAGLFARGPLARFANVLTLRAHRRRGYARILIGRMLYAIPPGVTHTVILAESHSPGEALYRSLNFEPLVEVRTLRF